MMSNFPAEKFNKFSHWRRLAHSVLPQRCALCTARADHQLLCPACTSTLPALPAHCPQCASPTPEGRRCGRCLAQPPAFVATRCAFVYAYPLDGIVHALKYGGRAAYAEIFAHALAQMPGMRPDCLVPLPLAATRQRERGFNQATEIARHLASHIGVPILRALVRTRDTQAQAALPWHRREANVRGAFAAIASLTGARVALIDDVMTTGATLDAAARAALAAGAATVEAWIGARTLPPDSIR
ncbi:MAG: ComF family protein [Betaproteobacteria bacterium]